MIIHVVTAGETVFSIAERYQVPPWTIIYNNELRSPDSLAVGQALLILGAGDAPVRLNLRAEAYAYPFTLTELLHEAFPAIRTVLSFSVGFTEDGRLLPFDDVAVRELAAAYGLPVMLVLTPLSPSGTFNNQLVHAVSTNPQTKEKLIGELLTRVRMFGYAGVDVDCEYILREDREGYAAFVSDLRSAMNAEGFLVSVALAPKTSDDQPGLLYEGMDYALLGAAANQVLLMTYEWGYTYGPAMAVAPLNMVRAVAEYAVTRIPPEKIFMGIPNYAYDWVLPYIKGQSRATTIGNVDAVQIAVENDAQILYDETAQTPHFTYIRNEIMHEVWFEDVRSIDAKLHLAAEFGFQGVTYWNLLKPFRANWELIQQVLNQ